MIEEIKKQEPEYQQILKGYKDVIKYKTTDLKIFEKKEEAIKHQEIIDGKKSFDERYKHKKIYLNDCTYDVIYLKDLDKKSTTEVSDRFYRLSENDLTLGWNLIETDDSGDYTYVTVYSLVEFLNNLKSEVKQLEDILNEQVTVK